ncbi:hypothetical protein Psi01_59850 [Planobispora siamensis]|uniref:Uncharacterized protein n=1 Tax=Planobispora siamensis TaxID=936338 RepID=A0A8J3SLH5_9ACTN|nr:hypothetical protein [Planobispora siamensis]GIH95355.1 hypothetical protein Psi01_59850 [Planobispora siamensis]
MPKFGAQIDTQQIPVKSLVAEASGTAPSSPATGQQWTDTSASPPVLKVWNGSAWVRADGADLPDGTVTNNKIASGANIALSKLAVDPLARANHTGSQAAATISDFDAAVRASRLDQMTAPTASVNFNGQKITSLGSPTLSTDAATKQYVDDSRAGFAGIKDPVKVAVSTDVTLSAPGATLDGVTMNTGDRFLAYGQSTGTQNGIYIWNGAASAATRAPDADAAGEVLDGTLVAVAEGTRAGGQMVQTATPSGAPGAWTQTWVVFTTSGTTYLAGAGLTLTGNTFDVAAADGSIVVNADNITVGLVPVSKGGTNATTAAAARTNLAAVTAYSADAPALTAGVAANVVHNLGTTDVQVYVREISGGARIHLDEAVVDANTISLKADIAYGSGTLRVVVQAKA